MRLEFPAIMTFLFPDDIGTDCAISYTLPRKYASQKVAGAEVTYLTGTFGSGLLQEIKNNSFIIGWFCFTIKQPVNIYPTPDTAMVALYCTLKGTIPCKLQGVGKVLLEKNKYGFYYVPPQQKNIAQFLPGSYEGVYISFAQAYLADFMEQNPQFTDLYQSQQLALEMGKVLPRFPMGQDEHNTLVRIKQCDLQGTAHKIFLKARINDILVSYFSSLEIASRADTDMMDMQQDVRIKEMIFFIQKNFHQPLSIKELYQQYGFRRSSFDKQFYRLFQVTPRKYIENVRLAEAERLLRETAMPVSDIAYRSGFSTAAYFSYVFAKSYHCSPSVYRQRHC